MTMIKKYIHILMTGALLLGAQPAAHAESWWTTITSWFDKKTTITALTISAAVTGLFWYKKKSSPKKTHRADKRAPIIPSESNNSATNNSMPKSAVAVTSIITALPDTITSVSSQSERHIPVQPVQQPVSLPTSGAANHPQVTRPTLIIEEPSLRPISPPKVVHPMVAKVIPNMRRNWERIVRDKNTAAIFQAGKAIKQQVTRDINKRASILVKKHQNTVFKMMKTADKILKVRSPQELDHEFVRAAFCADVNTLLTDLERSYKD
jgi:hypothetical protein